MATHHFKRGARSTTEVLPRRATLQRFDRFCWPRPILLTTATTVASLVPLYLGGNELWQPLAVAIMSGLIFATALTLGFVPLLYSILYRVSFRDFTYTEVSSEAAE